MISVQVNDFDHWRKQARELLKRGITPDRILWQHAQQSSLLLGDDGACFLSLKVQCHNPKIPRDFFCLAEKAACYRDESRWSLLYSLAWRLIFEDRHLLDYKIDSQVARLLAMKKGVDRDKHKMKAFVRFRLFDISDKDNQLLPINTVVQEEYFVAWFEPEHLILPLVTPFFIKRFTHMSWSILTPDACVHWNREQALFTEGVTRPPAIKDHLEDLWREYYANIFNPARLKLKAMQSEMPKKYWKNLPEAPLIAELTRTAGKQVDVMIHEQTSQAWPKTAKSRYILKKQQELRTLRREDSK